MDGLHGSTPWKPYDLSPLKTPFSAQLQKTVVEDRTEGEANGAPSHDGQRTEEGANGDARGPPGSPIIRSSSPPRPNSSTHVLDASPTMSRPATAVARALTQLSQKSTQDQIAAQLQSELPQGSDEAGNNSSDSRPTSRSQLATPALTATSVASTTAAAAAPPTSSQHDDAGQAGPSQPNRYHQQPHHQSPTLGAYGLPSGHVQQQPPPTTTTVNGYHHLQHDDGDDEGIDLAKYAALFPIYPW
jgi:forkhead protein FKH